MNRDQFFQQLHGYADSSARLSDDHECISYAQLVQRVEHLSAWLQAQQIHRLGVMADNSLAWLIADLAALHAGITLVPVPPFFTLQQQQQLLDHAQVYHLLSDRGALHSDWSAVSNPQLAALTLWQQGCNSMTAESCKITYTSGSTAEPKGVRLSEQVLLQTIAAIDAVLPADCAHRHVAIMPLAVLLENIAGAWLALWRGMSLHLPSAKMSGLQGSSQLDIQQFWRLLRDYAADSLITTPALAAAVVHGVQAEQLNAAQFGFIAVGGAAVPAQLLNQAQQLNLPLYQGYGLSECGSVVSLNTPRANRWGSVGKALPGVTLSLHDGELWVAGKPMDGYLGAHNISQEVIATGDLATIDHDGYLTIHGRKKNLLITSFGRNISPEWPENLAAQSPYWSQFMVCGDGYPGLVAILTATAAATNHNIDDAITQLNRQLPDYARIVGWVRSNEPFSQHNQQLTFNNRFRRHAIVAAYEAQISQIFGD